VGPRIESSIPNSCIHIQRGMTLALSEGGAGGHPQQRK
jgi:hypothetical protein